MRFGRMQVQRRIRPKRLVIPFGRPRLAVHFFTDQTRTSTRFSLEREEGVELHAIGRGVALSARAVDEVDKIPLGGQR